MLRDGHQRAKRILEMTESSNQLVWGMQRLEGRASDQLRPVTFELGIAPHASGSVLVAMGNTRVICGVMIEEGVPRWMSSSAS